MNRNEIEQSIINTITSLTSSITYFGKGGVIRSIIAAVSGVMHELFYDINRAKRSLFASTAKDTDLDTLARDFNMERLGASYASAVLIFSGTASTSVPAGTQIQSTDGIIFETLEAITLGDANSGYDFYPSESLGDKVEAKATTIGAVGNVKANTINTLSAPISGVDYVTNPSPAIGGADTESDNDFRVRISQRIDLLNLGTLAFFEAIAKEINPEVLRVYACRGESEREIAIYVATRSGTNLTYAEKLYLAESLRTYCPILTMPVIYDLPFTDIDISIKAKFDDGYTIDDVFNYLVINLAEYIDWSRADFGEEIEYKKILEIAQATEGIKDIDLTKFSPLSNIQCPKNSIPRLGTVELNDADSTDTINYLPNTTYLIEY